MGHRNPSSILKSVTFIIIFLGNKYEGLINVMKKQNDHFSSLTFTVG